MSAIFISYRRDDAEGHAGRLFEDLVDRFGSDTVFMDVAGIDPGRDFRKVIDEKVAECGVLLAMIGKNWLDAADEAGARRIDNPRDFVRLETSSALQRDIPVIPVLVQGATMPQAAQLPDDLADLAYRNAVELTHARWPSDVQVLVAALERLNVGIPRTAPPPSSTADPHAAAPSASPAVSPVPVSAAPEPSRPTRSGIPRSTMIVGAALIVVLAFVGWAVWSADSDDIAAAPTEEVAGSGIDAPAGQGAASGTASGFNLSAHDIRRADFASADGSVAGSFRETGDGVWSEFDLNGQRRFSFSEEARDDWSVELWDASRNVAIVLDLEARQVNVKEAADVEYRRLYTLVDVE